jgi:hypothetical protein
MKRKGHGKKERTAVVYFEALFSMFLSGLFSEILGNKCRGKHIPV